MHQTRDLAIERTMTTPWTSALRSCLLFFFNDTATTEIYTLSLHDALPISLFAAELALRVIDVGGPIRSELGEAFRSEEHTSELQSHFNLVCRLLLEKKKRKKASSSGSRIKVARTVARKEYGKSYRRT